MQDQNYQFVEEPEIAHDPCTRLLPKFQNLHREKNIAQIRIYLKIIEI